MVKEHNKLFKKRIIILIISIATVAVTIVAWTFSATLSARFIPEYSRVDIDALLNKPTLDESDYKVLFMQTGLGRVAIDDLLAMPGGKAAVLEFQNNFFSVYPYKRFTENLLFYNERFIDGRGEHTKRAFIAPLKDGDILISRSSHFLGWRCGHSALTVSGDYGIILEAMSPGQLASLDYANSFSAYPSFMVLRLKNISDVEGREIAGYAFDNLRGLPYSFFALKTDGKPDKTHCSHLIWKAFAEFGYDLDSDGGLIVTPKDLAQSPLVEIVQVYGVDTRALWS